MEVEVRQGNASFLSLDEDVQVVLVERNRDNKTPAMMNGRDDASTCCGRDGSLDNTRQTISTFSILDLTKDDDDDDSEEEEQSQSLLFEELQYSHPSAPSTVATPAFQIPYLKTVTDSFVDSLCHGSSPTCTLPAACYTTPSSSSSKPYSQHAPPQNRLQVGVDVWELLGCASSPTASDAYWTTSTVSSNLLQLAVPLSNKAIRASRQQRKNQLDRWKQQQQLRLIKDVNPTRHGRTTTPSPTSVISKAYTMDDMSHHHNSQHHHPSSDHHLAHVIGQGIDPILPDGYDSDPEFSFDTTRQSASPHSSLMDNDEEEEEEELMDDRSEDEHIHQMVQETLNSTWTLTWHPNPKNLNDHNGSNNKPTAVNIWLERGMVLPKSGTVVEPQLKWRDTHQPLLSSRKTLNASTQTPWSIRLLNTCRIAPVTNSTIDRNIYPLARASTSFLVRTCQGQEYLLEASSPKQCSMVCHRWKIAVARFASLAVTEDLDAIADEFFHPTTNSQMLTVHDNNTILEE